MIWLIASLASSLRLTNFNEQQQKCSPGVAQKVEVCWLDMTWRKKASSIWRKGGYQAEWSCGLG